MNAYPKRLHPRVTREGLVIDGIAAVVGFALTFVLSWYFPSFGTIWLLAAAAQCAYSLFFSRKAILRSVITLTLTCAAVFAAAALH